ncbi:phosphopantothenoylcysteine decarboxylase [Nothobranchius furzeri]|uniref:Phosphopantothenoylcysteine decarboxylase n=3 Tax=Nothobranchius TaxID=28779 RepID=A0A1A8AK35_NOTFU|nr:phosphopantothenoylcysteine decarboxylase [Nothobranchius furzeri]KAF7224379.1 phosphopantothenoylcysteine decarboxylase [Nothobranchius furzeri]
MFTDVHQRSTAAASCGALPESTAIMQTDDSVSSLKKDLLKPPGSFRVLVGVTGSVAALKLPALVSELLQLPGVDVRVVTTEHAKHFYNPAEVSVNIYSDKDEWEFWTQRSDPVLHIELRRWADLLIIAPLDANTLGKIASGICDNLLTCVVRAWDIGRPLLFCPAMNTAMWQHPITAQQVSRLKEFGYVEVPCISKKLVCGDDGKGAMAEVSTIVSAVKHYLPDVSPVSSQ